MLYAHMGAQRKTEPHATRNNLRIQTATFKQTPYILTHTHKLLHSEAPDVEAAGVWSKSL